MENLINKLPERFDKAIKDFGITEVFIHGVDFFITSDYAIYPRELEDDLKTEALKLSAQ